MTWLVAAASLFATWLNIRRVRVCFAIWFVTNVSWCVVDCVYGVWARAPLDAIYAALAVWGWIAWGRRTGSPSS
ncbi:MAG: hypothetical protein ACYS6Z_16580 [Planctomycetota bacterium]|jgi:nicotinamide riboside transporter PnuC